MLTEIKVMFSVNMERRDIWNEDLMNGTLFNSMLS
jgi:hypothetical protein